MKITAIETIPVLVPIKPHLAIRSSKGVHSASPFLILKVYTDEGIIGLGEVSCTPIWSGEDHYTASHFISKMLSPQLIGEDPRNITKLIRLMDSLLFGNPFTKSGLEMAFWDILGKSAALPLYRLFGGAVRDSIQTKFSISGQTPERAAEIALWAVGEGFRTVKVKVGTGIDEDIARIRAVRKAIGPDIRLGVDANGGWSVLEAVSIIRKFEEFDIAFIEQPVSPLDTSRMAEVRSRVNLPIIADESVFNLSQAMAVIRARAADVLSVYVGKDGGITGARKIAAVAEAAGITCTVGSNLELGIASAAMIHLALSTTGIDSDAFPCDIIGSFYYENDLLTKPLPIREGRAMPLENSGLGVEIDEAALKRYRVSL